MEKKLLVYALPVLIVVDSILVTYAAFRAPYPRVVEFEVGSPASYVNLFIHVPLAITTYFLYAGGLFTAIMFLWKRKDRFDYMSKSFISIATLYAIYTLASGMSWAKEAWGAAWNWDPRQTGVLLLFVAYLVYFALRSSVSDPDREKVVASVYAIAAFSMVPLSYYAPKIAGASLHPTGVLGKELLAAPTARVLFVSRILVALSIGILVSVLPLTRPRQKTRIFKLGGVAGFTILLVSTIALLAPYIMHNTGRVEGGEYWNDTLYLVVRTGDKFVNLTYKPSEGEIRELLTEKGELVLKEHIIKIDLKEEGELASIEIVKPPTVLINVLFYGILLLVLGFVVQKLAISESIARK